MYFRAFGSLIRRLSRRGILRAREQAQAALSPAIFSRADLAATVPRHARYNHTIRDLAVEGSYYGAVSVAAFVVLAGSLYLLKKDTAEDRRTEVTAEKKSSRVTPEVSKDGNMDDAAIRAMFTDKDGNLDWCDYIDYLTFGKTFPKNKATYQYEEVDDMDEDTVDEAAMKARFKQWMKEYDKIYSGEEETAMRYERFKRCAKRVDRDNASKQGNVVFGLNHLSDITEEERQSMYPAPYDDSHWERYVTELKIQLALSKDGQREVCGSQILKMQGMDASHHEDQDPMSMHARREEAIRCLREVASRSSTNEKAEPHGPV